MESARTTVEPRSPVRVLIVDQAIDFGGSIVSTANLIRGLDRRQFEPIFVSSTSEELVGSKLLEARRSTRVIIARRFFHYRRLAKIMAAIQRLPIGLLQKPLIYSLYVVRHIGNLPYTLRIVYWMLRLRVDLVQLNNGTGADEVDLACMALRKPRVMFFRGYEPLGRIQRKCLIPGVRGFVSVSNHIRDEAIADGI